jgi:hypothetical protein
LEAGASVRRRWGVFLAAACASAVLAVGFGAAISRVGAAEPAPRLGTVPSGILGQAGYSLAPAGQPPYCGVERMALDRWVSTGQAGCAISEQEARAAPLLPFQATVREAVLARATGSDSSGVGRDRLVWLLVLRSSTPILPATECGPPVSTGPACRARSLGQVSNEEIAFVDATTGQVLTTVSVPTPAG